MRKAFSLTEVLVVMTIVAILAALVFSVAGGARRKAKESSCQSNLRQLYAAMQLYRNDYGDYPIGSDDASLVDSYLGGVKLKCFQPSNPNLVNSYALNGTPSPRVGRPDADELSRAFYDCREQRGGEFPVVYDDNHASKVYAYITTAPFFLLVRENGDSARVPLNVFQDMIRDRKKAPCRLELGMSNL